MCGEKAALPPGVLAPPGSPPRMRGKELAVGVIRQHGGITPAHAGKSEESQMMHYLLRDHPRTCGEKLCDLNLTVSPQGSPPHMRGKVCPGVPARRVCGITPAHAGKSFSFSFSFSFSGDHPRTCGEKSSVILKAGSVAGSPPHMRGKAQGTDIFELAKGITPAHAGKSTGAKVDNPPTRDHPRTCGEKAFAGVSVRRVAGSPPHMRGKEMA